MLFEATRRWFFRLLRRLRRGRGRRAEAAGRGGRAGRGRGKRQERPPTALGTFGTRIGSHAGIYGGGQAGALLLGLVTLAILTRFLDPAQFGEYALYYVFAALLSVLYTLGWVRGSLILVFGGKGGDEDDEDEDVAESGPVDEAATAADKRAALGTAIALIALIATAGTGLVAVAAPAMAELVAGDGGEGDLALLAGVAGALTAVWILASAVPRRERRPKTFVAVSLSRPALVLAATVPLVAVQPDVESAVLGLVVGSAAATLLALVAIRHSFRPAFKGGDVRSIARSGLRYAPLIIALFVIANGGVLLLGQYVAESEVGLFRVATGVAALASLPVGAFVTAWGPLRREPIYGAVEAERGRLAASGLLATYFILAAIGILLTLAVGADLLVAVVAPGDYSDAAPLIPLVGLGLLLYGLVRVIRRSAKFPRRADWFIALAVVAAFVFVGACLVLIPPLGTYGAALAGILAFLLACGGMLLRSQLGSDPIPFGYARIAGGLLIAAACYAVGALLGGLAGPLEPLVVVLAIAAYPVLLTITGIVPRGHLVPLRRVAKAALPGGSPAANGRVELNGLEDVQRALLEVLIRHRRPVGDVAPVVGVPPAALEAAFVEALREVAGIEGAARADSRVGAYLLSSAPVAARDHVWRRLSADGVDALEVDVLKLTVERLRRAPDRTWRS